MSDSVTPFSPTSRAAAGAELARMQEALRVSEASRRESQLYFEKSFHGSSALMSISDPADGRIIEVNDAFMRGSGYPKFRS